MKENLFEEYINDPNPEHWQKFPEFMWDLGFEMDCYASAPKNFEYDREFNSEKEKQDKLLNEMIHWTLQEVGNYIFSRYRELTHWSDYGYPDECGEYFFVRAFPILESKLKKEIETRNQVPSIEKFIELVIARWIKLIPKHTLKDIREYVMSDEGRYYLNQKYYEFLNQYDEGKITAASMYGKCVTLAADYLEGTY